MRELATPAYFMFGTDNEKSFDKSVDITEVVC